MGRSGQRSFDNKQVSSSVTLAKIQYWNLYNIGRWYPSSARISDGSQIIFGGALAGDFNDYNDNPTVSDRPYMDLRYHHVLS
jgi:hypothetical protein